MSLPPSVAELTTEHASLKSSVFSLWLLPGRQAMLHDGESIHVRVETVRNPIELNIPPELGDGLPFSFRVSSGAFQRLSWIAVTRANELLTGSRSTENGTSFIVSRAAVTHMRMIQTLDGRMAGASHRDIAAALFGDRAVHRGWTADGELRAQIRYLVRKSSGLASGGYRTLVGLSAYPGE